MITLLLIIANVFFSYKGLKSEAFFDSYRLDVDQVILNKDYKRLITSGFLHVNWLHLFFNMISLWLFSGLLESTFGEIRYLLIYFASLAGGSLLAVFIHRNHPDYTSVGASGAVFGIIFATIALVPGMSIGLFFLPISIPAWVFGLLYVGFSMYGIKSKKDNVGHEVHLGGALIGMLVALIMRPSAFVENYVTILIILVPTLVFIYLILTRPHMLLIDNYFFKTHKDHYSIDHLYNEEKTNRQKEVDRILEKINKRGMSSLTKREKDMLHEYSQKL